MIVRCPCCGASLSLEALAQNEAARELMVLLAGAGAAMRPLIGYLSFFRPGTRVLTWERSRKLAAGALELTGDIATLAAALTETSTSLEAKRSEPGWKPLSNHRYLISVLKSVSARVDVRVTIDGEREPQRAPTSKTGQALAALEERKRGPR